ncbi:IS3 family transposase [Paenibacillus larvae]|uniref:IS3 family transposase n=1 Tax=Paenibacillus larvae TaxID=1464 RepID=UPI00130E71CB
MKRELIQGITFQTPEQARKKYKYIELYYNTRTDIERKKLMPVRSEYRRQFSARVFFQCS